MPPAPEGNSNAMTHGVYYWLRTGEFPPGCEDVAETVDAFIAGCVSDLGGDEALTSMEAGVLRTIRHCAGVEELAFKYLGKPGVHYFKKTKEGDLNFRSLLGTVGVFQGIKVRALGSLGLKRRAREITGLAGQLERLEQAEQETLQADHNGDAPDDEANEPT